MTGECPTPPLYGNIKNRPLYERFGFGQEFSVHESKGNEVWQSKPEQSAGVEWEKHREPTNEASSSKCIEPGRKAESCGGLPFDRPATNLKPATCASESVAATTLESIGLVLDPFKRNRSFQAQRLAGRSEGRPVCV